MDCEPHHEVLKRKRVYLVGHLDLKGTLVLDQLAQDGVLSPEQLFGMRERFITNIELASALVMHLERRPYKDWKMFLVCLSEHGHEHIVKHLGRHSIDCPSGYEIVDLQHLMAAIIKEYYDNVPLWTLHSDRVTLPMDDIYVNLVLVRDHQYQHSEEQPLQNYKEIFRKNMDRGTIYLTGQPGVGKSTFVKRMCVDWAISQMKPVKPTESETFEQYQFVLPIFLRDIKENQTFCEVIAKEYQLRKHEAEALCLCIENTQEPILIILDGLDEYNENTSKQITDLIHRDWLQNVTLFLTSRYCSESVYSDEKPGRCTEVRLDGFSEAGVIEYITRFYVNQEDEGQELHQKIKSSDDLEHLSHIPAILLMMATLWESTHRLARTVTGFYEEFVAFIFARMEKKMLKMESRAKSTKDLIGRYMADIMCFGRLASLNVKTHRLDLTFQQQDVIKHLTPDDLKIGFLIEKHTFSREIFYLFIHKTVQEFFLSYYLVHSDKSTQQELLIQFFNSRRAFMESAMIRRFVVGLGGPEIQHRIQTLITGDEGQIAEMHTQLQLEYLSEHQDAKLTLPSSMKLYINNQYPASHYVRYLRQDGSQVKKLLMWSAVYKHHCLLQHLQAPQLAVLHLEISDGLPCSMDSMMADGLPCSVDNVGFISQTLDMILTRFPLKQLSVCGLPDEGEAYRVVKAIVQMPTLQELSFYPAPLTRKPVNPLVHWLWGPNDSPIETLVSWLPDSGLRSLTMCGSLLTQCLTPYEVMGVISALPRAFHTLNVRRNNFRGLRDMEQQLSAISNSGLQTLNMSDCRLRAQDVFALVNVIPETLSDLDIGYNCQEGEGDKLGKLLDHATRISRLKRLNISYNNISPDVKKTMKQGLAVVCPSLQLEIEKQRWLSYR